MPYGQKVKGKIVGKPLETWRKKGIRYNHALATPTKKNRALTKASAKIPRHVRPQAQMMRP